MNFDVMELLNNVDFDALAKYNKEVVSIDEKRAIPIINDVMGYPMLCNKRGTFEGKPTYTYTFAVSKDNSTLDISWIDNSKVECSILITPFDTYVYEMDEEISKKIKEVFHYVQMESEHYLPALTAKFTILMHGSEERKKKWGTVFKQKIEEYYEQQNNANIM